jgi:hypothetical protein
VRICLQDATELYSKDSSTKGEVQYETNTTVEVITKKNPGARIQDREDKSFVQVVQDWVTNNLAPQGGSQINRFIKSGQNTIVKICL